MSRPRARLAAIASAVLVTAGLALVPGSPAAAAAGLSATYTKSSDWGTGFEATYKITNASAAATTNWTLVFTLPTTEQISSLWEGTFTRSGTTVTVRNQSWNGAIAVGGSVTVGFDVAYTGSYVAPSGCLINNGACDGSGGGGGPDTQAPSVPAGLTAGAVTASSVSLSWSASTDNVGVTGYTVFRNGTQVATVGSAGFTDSGLAASTTFTYRVAARDAAGNTSAQSTQVSATTLAGGGGNTGPFKKVGYFAQWSIYGRAFNPKNVETTGQADALTHINYAFENIGADGRCFERTAAGVGDAFADYQKSFDAATSVDGVADTFSQPLRGNFNQFKKLKARHPNLKVLLSLGGWTYSKTFSDVALTAASRQAFVSSCIDLFIKGNLPTGIDGDPAGGPGSAAGIFDGIDIDWEWPGSDGNVGNVIRPADKQNFTLLLQEFRRQLDAYGSTTGKHYLLSAFLPADPAKIAAGIEVGPVFNALDWATIQGYDFHGAWEPTTNHQGQLFAPAADPAPAPKFSVDLAIGTYRGQGAAAAKLLLGIPFYGRGWTNVPATNGGLYQPGSAAPGTFEAGIEDYKKLKVLAGTRTFDNTNGTLTLYTGSTFWSYDDERVIARKAAYIKSQNLGGAMVWELDGDDGTLTAAVNAGLR
ncbi:MAG TPA: glycosyl hydrolase family 18 protein [Mycobacteriales bacterium]|nr:glycosyl hydrolase family 18 protein [Mycobacteriales bacterium]